MNKKPLIISSVLIVLTALASIYITSSPDITLSDFELINAFIALAACLGAFISATFVIFSYLQTNKAYIESQRPHLLIFIENLQIKENESSDKVSPMTRIHYRNITNNRFLDLTLKVIVTATNRNFDISDLFRKKMTMIGQDSRQRNFSPLKELSNRGLDIQAIAEQGNEVILKISYSYTFNDSIDNVEAQMYKWDAKRRDWSIY